MKQTTLSDKRIKTQIQPVIYNSQVENFIDQLKPSSFVFNYGVQKQVGMIAQDVLTAAGSSQLLKSCVGNLDTYDASDDRCPLLTIKYDVMIPILILQLQNSKGLVDALEEKVQNLEARVLALETNPYP